MDALKASLGQAKPPAKSKSKAGAGEGLRQQGSLKAAVAASRPRRQAGDEEEG